MDVNLKYEKDLLLSIKQDKNRFGELYKYFVNDVYRFSYSILNNQHDAEDTTSQAFIELYKNIEKFEWQEISLKYWLFKTVRNLSYKKIGKEKRLLNLDKDEDIDKYQEQEISFVDQIMNLELVEQVKAEIQKLSPIEQELINLRIWEGLSFKEIAELQDSTENTSIKRFSRAIQKLKNVMDSKGIKSLLALPFLYSAIKQSGTAHAYLAPTSLIESNFENGIFIKNKLIMEQTTNKLTTIITSKAGIALIVIFTLAVSAVGGLVLYKNKTKTTQSNSENAYMTPTPDLNPSVTPTLDSQTKSNVVSSRKVLYTKLNDKEDASDDELWTFDTTSRTEQSLGIRGVKTARMGFNDTWLFFKDGDNSKVKILNLKTNAITNVPSIPKTTEQVDVSAGTNIIVSPDGKKVIYSLAFTDQVCLEKFFERVKTRDTEIPNECMMNEYQGMKKGFHAYNADTGAKAYLGLDLFVLYWDNNSDYLYSSILSSQDKVISKINVNTGEKTDTKGNLSELVYDIEEKNIKIKMIATNGQRKFVVEKDGKSKELFSTKDSSGTQPFVWLSPQKDQFVYLKLSDIKDGVYYDKVLVDLNTLEQRVIIPAKTDVAGIEATSGEIISWLDNNTLVVQGGDKYVLGKERDTIIMKDTTPNSNRGTIITDNEDLVLSQQGTYMIDLN
jgi:RNA polymerase sigma factor (sigma-70 family)